MGSESIIFNLKVETMYHVDLGKRLYNIVGIVKDASSKQFPPCMDHEGVYSFILQKGDAFTWKELMPQVKEIFNDYFTGGVVFTGYQSNISN